MHTLPHGNTLRYPFGLFLAVVIVLGSLVVPFSTVFAQGKAEASLIPRDRSVTAGEYFDVEIFIDPQGEGLDTVRINLEYPGEFVQVDAFDLGELFPEAAPGNSIDNGQGRLSQGGVVLNGEVTAAGVFGKVVFLALKEGSADIKVSKTSRLISDGEEKINTQALVGATITIGAALPEGPIHIESTTHPNQAQWSNQGNVQLSWTIEDGVQAKEYLLIFNNSSDTTPADLNQPVQKVVPAATNAWRQDNVADGIWYLHVQAETPSGEFSPVSHYRVQVDSTPPNIIALNVENTQLNEGDSNLITFGTTDDTAGIDHYELSVNNNPYTVATSPLVAENLTAGNYFVQVKALDRAQNVTFGQTTFRVYPKGAYDEGIGAEKVQGISTQGLWIIFILLVVVLGVIIKLTLQKRKK